MPPRGTNVPPRGTNVPPRGTNVPPCGTNVPPRDRHKKFLINDSSGAVTGAVLNCQRWP